MFRNNIMNSNSDYIQEYTLDLNSLCSYLQTATNFLSPFEHDYTFDYSDIFEYESTIGFKIKLPFEFESIPTVISDNTPDIVEINKNYILFKDYRFDLPPTEVSLSLKGIVKGYVITLNKGLHNYDFDWFQLVNNDYKLNINNLLGIVGYTDGPFKITGHSDSSNNNINITNKKFRRNDIIKANWEVLDLPATTTLTCGTSSDTYYNNRGYLKSQIGSVSPNTFYGEEIVRLLAEVYKSTNSADFRLWTEKQYPFTVTWQIHVGDIITTSSYDYLGFYINDPVATTIYNALYSGRVIDVTIKPLSVTN